MSIKSKLKIGNLGTFAALIFYASVGIISCAILPIANFPPHIGIIGILSLITSYGLFKQKVWTRWIIFVLFFVGTTFSAYTLYFFIGTNPFLGISMAAYLFLTWFFTAYVVAKKNVM